jgi:hypothetical protein
LVPHTTFKNARYQNQDLYLQFGYLGTVERKALHFLDDVVIQ